MAMNKAAKIYISYSRILSHEKLKDDCKLIIHEDYQIDDYKL